MTSTRYYIFRLAQAFGYSRRKQSLADASTEMHLLREAESQLGADIWKNVEAIEELSVQYWNLRKLTKNHELVTAQIEACHARLDAAHEKRDTVISSAPEPQQKLLDQRTALLLELEKLAMKRDKVIAKARELRRIYDGLKMKLEVLVRDNDRTATHEEQIRSAQLRLAEIKVNFEELKEERTRIGKEIEESDAKVDLVDRALNSHMSDHKASFTEAFQVIGDSNKDMASLRAEAGVIEDQILQLHGEIGRYVSRNSANHRACAAAAASRRGLVNVMHALRQSIARNHRLAGEI
jgi:chromosome segregation ATPase